MLFGVHEGYDKANSLEERYKAFATVQTNAQPMAMDAEMEHVI